MARELYNWDQLESYAGYAFYLLKEKYPELNIKTDTYLSELRPLQTRYGKEGMIGLANRCIKRRNNNGKK